MIVLLAALASTSLRRLAAHARRGVVFKCVVALLAPKATTLVVDLVIDHALDAPAGSRASIRGLG